MSNCVEKFSLLMWKNFLLQWRHPIQTVIEMAIPILFASLLVVFRSMSYDTQHAARVYTPFDPSADIYLRNLQLFWSPSNDAIDSIMYGLNASLSPHQSVHLSGFKDSKSLETHLISVINTKNATWGNGDVIAGVQFDDSLADNVTELPPQIDVTLRFPAEMYVLSNYVDSQSWMTNVFFPKFQMDTPRQPYDNEGGSPRYQPSGFLMLQKELSYSIIKYLKKQVHNLDFNSSSRTVLMQRFPYAGYTEDTMQFAFQFIVPSFIMLSFLYPCVNTVKFLTLEKETQLKETMKIMGLPGWLHWTAWFIKSFILFFIPIIFLTLFMSAKWYSKSDLAILTYSNPFVIFILFLCYICASISYCFALSVFFSKAHTAAVVAGIVWSMSFTLFSAFESGLGNLSFAQKMASCLLSNSAMGYGFQLVMIFEGTQKGAQWDNLWEPPRSGDQLFLGHVLLMLVFDFVLYFGIALYVEEIFPGDYGVPQKWYFPFTRTYWCGNRGKKSNGAIVDEDINSTFFEKEPTQLEVGVKMQNLRKEFSKNVAVKNLSLNLYKDQITVLLGHNGAGKTTTMSMLTGMIPPTSGRATVAGHDVQTDIDGVRDSLGLCPQHNILFDELSVREHLYFYSRLKGFSKNDTLKEIVKFLELLQLTDKENAKALTLSGGMKRKLSVAIALCGNSKVVMCDEPSSGMDPSARRALWDLLKSQKEGRTILLTTHFMDEADLLGDRIAIMSGGELQCCGSSYFLKKAYGAGYRLVMERNQECETEQVTVLLRKYIPDIKVESSIGSELTYILDEKNSSIFQEMLYDLETNSHSLGISSYGISITSFDEVFIKARWKPEETENVERMKAEFTETRLNMDDYTKHDFLSGSSLWFNQALAVLLKRGLSILRAWVLFIIQNLIPILFVVINIIIARNVGKSRDLPSLKYTLDFYSDSITPLTWRPKNQYVQSYKDNLLLGNKELIDWKQQDMNETIIEEEEKDRYKVRMQYVVGAHFGDGDSIISMFNNEPYHSRPLTLQMALNSVLRKEVTEHHNLQFSLHPLPFSTRTKLNELQSNVGTGFILTMFLSFGLAFVSSFYVLFYVRERANNVKHLQFVSGIRVTAFWVTTYVCDLVTFLFTSCCIIATFAIFQEENFKTPQQLGQIFSMLFCFGLAFLPLVYLLSYLFQVPTSGFTVLCFINFLLGVTPFILTNFLKQLMIEHNIYFIHTILLLMPLYSFSTGLKDLTMIHSSRGYCTTFEKICVTGGTTIEMCKEEACKNYEACCYIPDYYSFEEPGIGKNVLMLVISSIIYFSLLLAIDYRLFDRIFYKLTPSKYAADNEDDPDVAKEKVKIREAALNGEIKQYDLIVHNITKYYKNFLAVSNVCLGVNRHECFGLLGVNGAGKTTTFKMMTGDLRPSSGDAWIKGLSLKSDMKEVNKLIGYCPQFDALLDDLTCWETILIFGLIRGISLKESKQLAGQLARDFDFLQHLHKKVKELSGGNKRKLSTAIALIGDPLVIYLDEPTTGMDPATKRYLWNALCKIRDSGKCIILTSHSMEECEALCTRLAIMVNGEFKCIGSTQHLKSRFSEGYTLIIRIKKDFVGTRQDDVRSIEEFVKHNFKSAILREAYQELLTFYIPSRSHPWSKMFQIMETAKKSLNIEDYSLGQSSLEQVFLSFTKYQQM